MSAVLIAAPDLDGEPDLVAAMTAPGSPLRVVRRCVDAVDLLGAATAGGATVALVGAALPRVGRDVLSRVGACGVRIIGLVARGDLAGEQALRSIDVIDVLAVDAVSDPASAVVRIAERVAAAEAAAQGEGAGEVVAQDASAIAGALAPHSGQRGRTTGDHDLRGHRRDDADPAGARAGAVIAVWGPPGAPGVTSVAVGLADELARLQRDAFLVDADPVGGAVAVTLGMLQESSGLAIAARRADHGGLDIDGLARTARRIRPGLRVLTGVDAPERGTLLRPAAVATVCRVARMMSEVTVVDAGTAPVVDDGARAAVTRAVLGEADAIVVVGAADPVGMSRLVPAIGHAQGFGVPVHVVVTRLRVGVLGRDGQGQVCEALRRHAGCVDVLTVPDDRAAYDEALREGRTVSECAPRSAARTALIDLAQRLSRIGQCLPQTEHPAA